MGPLIELDALEDFIDGEIEELSQRFLRSELGAQETQEALGVLFRLMSFVESLPVHLDLRAAGPHCAKAAQQMDPASDPESAQPMDAVPKGH